MFDRSKHSSNYELFQITLYNLIILPLVIFHKFEIIDLVTDFHTVKNCLYPFYIKLRVYEICGFPIRACITWLYVIFTKKKKAGQSTRRENDNRQTVW